MGIYPVVALLSLLMVLGGLLKDTSYGGRWIFGVGVACFMFMVGVVLTEKAWDEVRVDWPEEEQTYRGVLQEMPLEKPKTYQCRISVSGKEVLAYVAKDSLSSSLRVGDEIQFITRIEPPQNQSDSLAFDYARYLYHKGISGVAFIPSHEWEKTGQTYALSLKQRALAFRAKLLEKYRRWGVGERQMPVLSALTLGYKGDLDKDIKQAYSVAGIAHVLALSGMHIGVIWFLLSVFLKFLLRGRLKLLEWCLVTMVLWAFAFVVGLEASVVRAVVMCMLMGVGRLTGSKILSMNTLSIAAFFMLIYHPFYLFDVGFQLSFVAVASILAFYPLIFGCVKVRQKIWRWTWGVVSVSVAAQLGTAPLVMYYFSSFSVYFLLANLIVAVLVPLIFYTCVCVIVASPFVELQVWLVKVLNGLVDGLNGVAQWTARLPYATFSLSVLKPLEVVITYAILVLVFIYWKSGKRRWLLWILAAIVGLLAIHLFAVCCP